MVRREEMGCGNAVERLEALVDGELGAREQAAVESHLASCPGCRRERTRALALRGALRELPNLDPPADLLERVRAAARAEDEARQRRGRSRRRAWPALAAAAVVLLAAGATLLRTTARSLPDPQLVRARVEVTYAFALVADTCRRAGALAGREVVAKRIVDPSAGALSRALRRGLTAGEPGPGLSPVDGG